MSIVFKFMIVAGFFFALAALRWVAIYSSLSVALNDGIARGLQLSRDGIRASHKVYRPYP